MTPAATNARVPRTLPTAAWVVAAGVVTLLLLIASGWHVYNTYQSALHLRSAYRVSEDFHDTLHSLQQGLVAAAALAAATGKPQQEARYQELDAQLTSKLNQAQQEPGPGFDGAAIDSIAAARSRLRATEEEALALARGGRRGEGLGLLTSTAYGQLDHEFHEAVGGFVAGYENYFRLWLKREARQEAWSLAAAGAIFALSLGTWMVLVLRLDRWRAALVRESEERTRAEGELASSLAKYRTLFEDAYDGILIVDSATGRVVDANRNAAARMGFERRELLDIPLSEIDPKSSLTTIADAGADESVNTRCYARKSGGCVPVEVTESPLVLDGRPARQLRLRDLTERRTLENELAESQKMEAVGQLAAGMAHDFNNLLTAIQGYAERARAALPDGKDAGTSLARIEEAASQARRLTHDLLTFSRKAEREVRPIDLGDLVGESANLLRGMLPASIQLNVTCVEPTPWTHGDPTQIQQALLNLAINARDAMPVGGELHLTLDAVPASELGTCGDGSAPRGAVARLRVSDSGTGMSPEVQRRACEPFFTTKARGRGTGLGLAVVHGIVNAHRGRLMIDSEAGAGTTVTILLPASEPEPAMSSGDATTPPRKEAAAVTGTVLLAEDHAYVRELMTDALQAAGHTVIAVSDGQQLLAAFAKQARSVSAVILDLDLPVTGGHDCLRTLRAQGSHVPAIVVTGLRDPELEQRLGGDALLLHKPFAMAELVRLTSRVVTKKQAQ
jgi:PAS domain S-box-containing protein